MPSWHLPPAISPTTAGLVWGHLSL
jgi:hypothetical protein